MTLATPPEVRRPVRFTPEEFHALSEQGVIPERTELVDGEIIEMPAQHYPAVATISEIQFALREAWPHKRCVVSNMTHVFPSGWNPMPDVAVYDRPPPRRPKEGAYPVPRLVVEGGGRDARLRPGREGGAVRGGGRGGAVGGGRGGVGGCGSTGRPKAGRGAAGGG